jgi:hypothetical protein
LRNATGLCGNYPHTNSVHLFINSIILQQGILYETLNDNEETALKQTLAVKNATAQSNLGTIVYEIMWVGNPGQERKTEFGEKD